MKTEQPILITSVIATGELDFTITKNTMVNFNGAVLDNSAKQFGVCNADTNVGEQMPVVVCGIALIKTYAAVTKGAKLMCGEEGKVTTWESGAELVGYALDSASGSGELIRVLLV